MALSDVWDSIVDGFDYFIHFEWIGDFWEGVQDFFSNISEISSYGIIFGLIMCIFLFLTQDYMLGSFTKLMKPANALITTILTYVIGFIVGYVVGKRFEDTA